MTIMNIKIMSFMYIYSNNFNGNSILGKKRVKCLGKKRVKCLKLCWP